ncbi:MAG: hypothetical protein JHC93_08605 [Parachlamydiales bacterium]|nr:hypothetical protein [Parachlamydiales bacterium]
MSFITPTKKCLGYYPFPKTIPVNTFDTNSVNISYYDPAQLPLDILVNILSQTIELKTVSNMSLVNKNWNLICKRTDFLNNVLTNYPFLNKKPGVDNLKAFCHDINTRKNIDEGKFRVDESLCKNFINHTIYDLKQYQSGLAVLADESLYNVDAECQIQELVFSEKVNKICVFEKKLFTLTKKSQIFEVQSKSNPITIFNNSSYSLKLDFSNKVFFEVIEGHFVICNNLDNAVCTYVIDKSGHICSSMSNKTDNLLKIDAMTVFDKSIILGLRSGDIQFYDKRLNLLKTYKNDETSFKEIVCIYSFSTIDSCLFSSSSLNYITCWNEDGTYRRLPIEIDCVKQIGKIGENIVTLDDSDISVWTKNCESKKTLVTSPTMRGFIIKNDQIIIYTHNSIQYLNFTSIDQE